MATVLTPERLITVEEYFELEVHSDRKHEFYGGRVSVMTGGSDNHIDICWNLSGLLHVLLKNKPFKGFGNDMRVEVVPNKFYCYPDFSVASNPPQRKKKRGTSILLNPVLIIEVLSPSTEAVDRGEKFTQYTKMPSLQEYLLVSQDRPQVERWFRDAQGQWNIVVTAGLDSSLTLESIQCTLPMKEIYNDVSLTPPETESDSPTSP